MANKLIQPGVTVTQIQRTQSSNIFNPSLVPFVCGPAKEIVNAFDELGKLNPKALQGPYVQLPKTISQTSFPSPRNNIAEVTVENPTIRVFFDFAGQQTEQIRDPGESFLVAVNRSQRACFRTIQEPNGGWDLNPIAGAKTLNMAINQPIRSIVTADKAVTFTSTNNARLTTQQVCDQINTVWGVTIATSITLTGESSPRVQIMSPAYGVLSSVTIRGGGSANTVFGFNAQEERIEAAGFRGQEQNDGTTQSPYIEFFIGAFLRNAIAIAFPAGANNAPYYGQMDEENVFTATTVSTVDFGPAGLDLRPGDLMYADGIKVKAAEVMKVEATRIKLGIVNTALSTYDANGKLQIAVRDQVKVSTLYDPAPFAPRFVWFKAENLTYPTAGNTAAVLTGANAALPAEPASFIGSAAITDFALSGLTFKYVLTVDGVEQPPSTITFTGTLADTNAVKDFINAQDNRLLASNYLNNGKIKIATVKTGKTQKIKVEVGTADTKLNILGAENNTYTGLDPEFISQAPKLTALNAATFAATINNGEKITIEWSSDNFSTIGGQYQLTSAGATYADINAAISALNTNFGTDLTWGKDTAGTRLTVTAKNIFGKTASIRVKNNAGDNAAAVTLGFTLTQPAVVGLNALQGETLKFKINDRTRIFSPLFLTNSLVDAVSLINEIVGYPIASIASNADKLVLTSDLKGMASKIEVISDVTSDQASLILGFGVGNRVATGLGRPNPDFYLDNGGNVVLGADILRHTITGYPYDPAQANIYIQYRGLRKDVSPLAKNPGLLSISDLTTLHAVLDPLTEENPLGLAMYFQLLNAPNVTCYGLGVDEISTTEPEGTLAAYGRVAEFIEPLEVWSIAPLTSADGVSDLFKTHVDTMSLPENKSERVVFISPKVPKRKVDTTIATGLAANSIVTQSNKLTIDVNPVISLLNNGINAALPIPYSAQLFITVLVNGQKRNYNISAVNGVVLTLNTTFGPTENLDGFFSTTTLTENVINSTWGMYIRGALLLIPGSTLVDKTKVAETVNSKASSYGDKRVRYVFPETVQAVVNGITKNIPSYYASAAYTGVRAFQAPQQGLTNFKITGFNGVLNSIGYYKREQLDVIAGGGVWTLINDGAGLPIYARQQLTTDVSTIESQEDSIVAIIDHASKLIRNLLRKFIGVNNVTKDVEDAISTLLDGIGRYLVEDLRSLVAFKVNGVYQDPKKPDTIKIDLTFTVPYPLNHIDVTIYV